MKNLKQIFAICTIAAMFASCEKGDQGPQGPIGDKGDPGNANVNSLTLSVTSSDWVLYVNPIGGNDWVAQKSIPQISSDIVSSGAVMVYMKKSYSNGGYYYQALPFSWVDTPTSTRSYGFSISPGLINIHVEDTDNSLSLGSYNFKIVVVNGAWRIKNPNVRLENYEEVINSLNMAN